MGEDVHHLSETSLSKFIMFNKIVFLQGLTPKTQMEDVHTHEAEAHAAGSAGLLLPGWARFSPLFF
jgi:hypothetical protein